MKIYIIGLIIVTISLSLKIDPTDCLEKNINSAFIFSTNFDGEFNYKVLVKKKKTIQLLNPLYDDVNFMKEYKKIELLIIDNYDVCHLKSNTILLINLNSISSEIKIKSIKCSKQKNINEANCN